MLSPVDERLKALREELSRRGLDGLVVPLADEHMSEYVGAYAQRLKWLTGFTGSAGVAVVLEKEATIFVDGRYVLQARQEVDTQHWSVQSVPQTSAEAWLGEHARLDGRIGYDPWLHTRGWIVKASAALMRRNAELVATSSNPVDAVWLDRPSPSAAELIVYPNDIAGASSIDKRRGIADWLAANEVDAVVVSALDSIAWLFNIRGQDITHTPVALAYAVIIADGAGDLFIAPQKLTDEVMAHLGDTVRCHPLNSFRAYLRTLADRRIAVDPERSVSAVLEALKDAGATMREIRDPVVLAKAVKNDTEIAGHKAAQRRDGAALCRFLHWLSVEVPKGTVTERAAAERLRRFREGSSELRDLSFETISSCGPNSAIIHYHPTAETDRLLSPGTLYLVDSGAQYIDGTTDVTRTVAIGEPTSEMRDRFTRVLKGHIAFARAVFPAGTRGIQLDTLARQYLWAAGLNYAHGTGHGVGAYLCVHEGPQLINSTLRADEPLLQGMIVSNEPGYYKTGEYGIRIENLMLIVEREILGAESNMLAFETLTFAPIDRTLIDGSLLGAHERAWIDSYHAEVARLIGPQLEGAAKEWLIQVTSPLRGPH